LSRGDLTEVEWRILRVLLPVERKRGRGRPPEDNRNIINGILWRLRTGAPWRDQKNTGNGTRSTGASAAGAPAACGRVWPPRSPRPWPRADITTSTALQFARMSRQRVEKGDSSTSSWPLAGWTSKIHCLGDARGRPIAFDLTAGEAVAGAGARSTKFNDWGSQPSLCVPKRALPGHTATADNIARVGDSFCRACGGVCVQEEQNQRLGTGT
jgi:transposase